MTDELVLYTNPRSRGRIARWMLEEVGEPYRTEVLDYNTSMKAPSYLAINPMGKVPAVQHGDVVITEAAAICAYLADAFPQAKLAPPSGDRLRAPYYRWLFFAAGPIEAAASNKALGFNIPPEREGYLGYGTFDRVMNVLEEAVSAGNYLAGETFTAADV
jgi:glutathione S-transferase